MAFFSTDIDQKYKSKSVSINNLKRIFCNYYLPQGKVICPLQLRICIWISTLWV